MPVAEQTSNNILNTLRNITIKDNNSRRKEGKNAKPLLSKNEVLFKFFCFIAQSKIKQHFVYN
jgi:hypothetical protein